MPPSGISDVDRANISAKLMTKAQQPAHTMNSERESEMNNADGYMS
jgi:hypothetical protein